MSIKPKTALTIAALGVVFGDIGTSPLYAFKECIAHAAHSGATSQTIVLGMLSLILWSLISLVAVKYVGLILKADNDGEGGILALLNLAIQNKFDGRKSFVALTVIGLLGAALLYGDGVITPAISVLSAVEGLSTISPVFDHVVIPISIVVLMALFAVQRMGTGNIGRFFGPIILTWFAVLGITGLIQVIQHPQVLAAINPLAGLSLICLHPVLSFQILGSVFLAVTGGEALYADMGHFGRVPIKTAWNFIVLPALTLNYLGQGALVLSNPLAGENPFFLLVPGWATFPMVILATMATVIASQALISGVFSLTTAALQMGYLPRIQILHTNHEESGQIYIPTLNTALGVACIVLVVGFKSSSALAAAYGIAVTLTMLATTTLFFFVATGKWGWKTWQALIPCTIFGAIEILFFASNALKVLNGGWITLAIGAGIFYMMTTWKAGRQIIRRSSMNTMDLPSFIDSISMSGLLDQKFKPHRVKGTAIFLCTTPDITPEPLIYNLTHNHVLHERNIVLTITPTRHPIVAEAERITLNKLPEGFYQVIARFGFMEIPTIQAIISSLHAWGLDVDIDHSTFFLGRETLIKSNKGMSRWRETAFIAMARNAQNAAQFFRLPSNRTVEIGKQVEI